MKVICRSCKDLSHYIFPRSSGRNQSTDISVSKIIVPSFRTFCVGLVSKLGLSYRGWIELNTRSEVIKLGRNGLNSVEQIVTLIG